MSTETGTQHRTIRRHQKSHLGSGPKANAARIAMARDGLRTCACGCGEPIPPTARFKRGHFIRQEHETRVCVVCGRQYKTPTTAARLTCKSRHCQGQESETARSETAKRRADRERRLADQVVELRASWTVEERRIVRAMRAAWAKPYRAKTATALREERDAHRRRLDEAARWVARERERETGLWLSELSPADSELARELLVDQEKDERRLQVQYEQSLDEPFTDGSLRPPPSRGVHFDREDDEWPYTAERSRRVGLRRIVRRRYNAGDEDYLVGDETIESFRRRKSSAIT